MALSSGSVTSGTAGWMLVSDSSPGLVRSLRKEARSSLSNWTVAVNWETVLATVTVPPTSLTEISSNSSSGSSKGIA